MLKKAAMDKENQFDENLLPDNYFLQPGYIFVPDQPIGISTVIGSGVSVCIYDRKKQTGGMNHFLFPHIAIKGKTTALYGNISMTALLKMMLAQESSIKHLEAQIYGGAYSPEKNNKDIGRENIEMARKILLKNRISITSQDVGGEKGRKVIFNTRTNEVAILKVDRLRDMDWYPYQ